MLFLSKQTLREAITEALEEQKENALETIADRHTKEVGNLKRDIERLEKEKREVEHKKAMEERELAHMVKMKEEKIHVETEKKRLELQEQFMHKTGELQTKFHEQVVSLLKEHQDKFQKTYEEIMKRLPNLNATIKMDR